MRKTAAAALYNRLYISLSPKRHLFWVDGGGDGITVISINNVNQINLLMKSLELR